MTPVLALVLAVLGLGVLGQFTVESARRGRRDYAVLKVLGMTRRDLLAVSLSQSGAVTVAALAAGIPSASSAATGPGRCSSARRACPPAPSRRPRCCG